jgi:amidase
VIATALPSLKLLMSAIVSAKPWMHDPALLGLSWREVEDAWDISRAPGTRKLCLAVMESDGVVTPHPPIARGIRMLIDALKRAGHTVSIISHYAKWVLIMP